MLQGAGVIVLAILMSSGKCQIPEIRVTLFSKVDFQGLNETFKLAGCTALLPSPVHKNIGSIDSDGNCVHLYRQANCTDEFEIVKPGSVGHFRIGDFMFQSLKYRIGENIEAISPCTPVSHLAPPNSESEMNRRRLYASTNTRKSTETPNNKDLEFDTNVSHSYAVPLICGIGIIIVLTMVIGTVWYRRRKLRFGEEPRVSLLL